MFEINLHVYAQGLDSVKINEMLDKHLRIVFEYTEETALNQGVKHLKDELIRRFGRDQFYEYYFAIDQTIQLYSNNMILMHHFITKLTHNNRRLESELIFKLWEHGYDLHAEVMAQPFHNRIPTWHEAKFVPSPFIGSEPIYSISSTIPFIKKSRISAIATLAFESAYPISMKKYIEIFIEPTQPHDVLDSLYKKITAAKLDLWVSLDVIDHCLLIGLDMRHVQRERHLHPNEYSPRYLPSRHAPPNLSEALKTLINILYDFEPIIQQSDRLFTTLLRNINKLELEGVPAYHLRDFRELLQRTYINQICGENASRERTFYLNGLIGQLLEQALERRLSSTEYPIHSSYVTAAPRPATIAYDNEPTEVKPKSLKANFDLEDYTCPITLEIMEDPVNFPQCENKLSFEKQAILNLFASSNDASHPVSRERIEKEWITSNKELKSEIEAYKRGEVYHEVKKSPEKTPEPEIVEPVNPPQEEPRASTLIRVKNKKKCVIL